MDLMDVDKKSTPAEIAKRKKAQPSRKGKKAWAKNIDLEDVEEALEEKRTEERTLGASIATLPNSALFSLDKSGDALVVKSLAKTRRKLRIDEILTPDSKIPGVSSRARAKAATDTDQDRVRLAKKKREASKTWTELVERKRRTLENGEVARGRVEPPRARSTPAVTETIWRVRDLPVAPPAPPPGLEFIPPIVPPKRPVTLSRPPIQQLPVSVLPHGGASYNPAFDDHQDALREAVSFEEEKERKRRLAEDKVAFLANGVPSTGIAGEPGLEELDASDDEAEEEGEGEAVEGDVPGGESKPPRRKTRAERNREARRKEIEREEAAHREAKKQVKQLKSLPSILASLPPTASSTVASSKPTQPPRLGPLRAAPPTPQVLLTEELPDALRKLQPEGNLLEDVASSLYAKGIVERRAVKEKGGGGKFRGKGGRATRKEFETHAYKRFE
ncbi:hypothetical protein HDU93_009145 [Gonapodya sp. JEL0774]|nr:hypothetical protein HDU93_009145 [Gonapodya sp. JEL0774]